MHDRSFARLAFILFLAAPYASARALPQTSADTAGAQDGVASASVEAREAWERVLAASAGNDAKRAPISAFTLRAEAVFRDGVKRNEATFDYRYLAPDCIEFALPSGSKTGRSGAKQRDYWLDSKDGLVELAGFEYEEDRRQINEMLSIAKNFVSLTDPSKLRIQSLKLLPEPPRELWSTLRRTTERMLWLRVTSPDFALVKRDGDEGAAQGAVYVVDLALPNKDARGASKDLPNYAIIREQLTPGRAPAPPMLIRLRNYTAQDGFLMPLNLDVFPFVRGGDAGSGFAEVAAQRVAVLEANLRPGLTVADFRPEEKR